MNETVLAARRIAQLAAGQGGRVYYVGGSVRDKYIAKLSGRGSSGFDASEDIDIEVHGLGPETMWDLLRQVGEPAVFGESFGVYSLRHLGLDIAMPRKEHGASTPSATW